METTEKLKIAMQALEDVMEPIAMFRRNLKPGEQLDGMWCVRLAESVGTYQNIANDALRKINEDSQ